MNAIKVKSYLGFAIKSGKALFGVDLITTSRRAPYIVLTDSSLSENSINKLNLYLTKYNVRNYTIAINDVYPDKNCKAVGVMDKHLANAIELEVKGDRV